MLGGLKGCIPASKAGPDAASGEATLTSTLLASGPACDAGEEQEDRAAGRTDAARKREIRRECCTLEVYPVSLKDDKITPASIALV